MRPFPLILSLGIAVFATTALSSRANALSELTEEEAHRLATEAYIYGYPLVTMEMTRRVMTNVTAPNGGMAPMGRFVHRRSYPTPSDKAVTAPNADTLYSLAWLDLSNEPYILSLPDADRRYYLMPMLSGWTDVFQVPGTRTTGTKAQTYGITGPGWKGTLPQGVVELKSPTSMVWLLGRTYCSGTPEDYKAAHSFQDKISLVPLSAYGKQYTPPLGKFDRRLDMKAPVRDQVNRMNASAYFSLLATLLKHNPPASADAPILAKMARIGIIPGQEFAMDKLESVVANGLKRAPEAGKKAIMNHAATASEKVNGWTYSLKTGSYGTDYLQRAYVTAIGLGANLPQDAIYPYAVADADGKPLSGAYRYRLHFLKDQTPPVRAFWSLTMYDSAYFFVPNPLLRYSISPRNPLKRNEDGSLDLYLQYETPGKDKESNWLPAPKENFILMLRMYWPEESIMSGEWKPPAVTKVE